MLHALGADVQVIFWFHLPPQMTIILGHSLPVKALGPKKECPYDVHRRFVSCNLTRCTLRLYPGKNLQKGCSKPGSSTKDPLNRKPMRQWTCFPLTRIGKCFKSDGTRAQIIHVWCWIRRETSHCSWPQTLMPLANALPDPHATCLPILFSSCLSARWMEPKR